MDRVRFQDLLDNRGGDLAAWPDADRIAAERLFASDPAAAQALEGARLLDGLIRKNLAGEAAEQDDERLAERILAGLPATLPAQEGRPTKLAFQAQAVRKAPKPWAFLGGAFMPRFAALSFAAALGGALGLFWAQQSIVSRQDVAAAEDSDVTSVIFQTDSANGTF